MSKAKLKETKGFIKEMQKLQLKLDEKIASKKNIDYKEFFNFTKTALIVELAEFANEVQFFKFWKSNKNIEQSKINEEFADCLHFYMSLANTAGIDLGTEVEKTADFFVVEENQNFIEIVKELSNVNKTEDGKESLKISFYKFLAMGLMTVGDFEVMFNSYKAKNKINYDRLKNNY